MDNFNINEIEFSILTQHNSLSEFSDNLEIIYILKGQGTLFNGTTDAISTVKENDIFVINRFQQHTLSLNNDCSALVMYIPTNILAALCPEHLSVVFNCNSFLYTENEQDTFDLLRQDFAKTFQEYIKNRNLLPIVIRSSAGHLLSNLIRFFSVEKNMQLQTKSKGIEHLRIITEYIHNHYKEELSLSQIASQSFLSNTYISHLFKNQLGHTFTTYLTNVRLSHALTLLASEMTITDIALKTGFANTNSFIEAFRQQHGITPGRYRKECKDKVGTEYSVHFEFSDALKILSKFIDISNSQTLIKKNTTEFYDLTVDFSQQKTKLKHKWRMLLNVGYAKGLRTTSIRSQVERTQKEIGFEYMRIKGCLNDELMICKRDENQKLIYNFILIDECIDFILSLDAKPWIELTPVPIALIFDSTKNSSIIHLSKEYNFNLPSKNSEWLELVKTFFQHLLEKYGEKQVQSWIFLPLSSLSYEALNIFEREDFFNVYKETVRTLRNLSPKVKIAGVNININELELTLWFLQKCKVENTLPDILALHSYNIIDHQTEKTDLKLMALTEGLPYALSEDPNYIANFLLEIKKMLHEFGIKNMKIVLSEWNGTAWQRDLCNDTCYKSTYIFKSILENYDNLDGMGYWSLSDSIDELMPSPYLFHGGFGLFTRTGLPKAGYSALALLTKVGKHFILKGDGYFISKDDNCMQVFLYNYANYSTLYRYRHKTLQTFTNRYNVLNPCTPKQYSLNIKNLDNAQYTIRKYSVGIENGSLYDKWIQMGAPDIKDDIHNYLEHQTLPLYTLNSVNIENEYQLKTLLQPFEIQVITITKE